jgi:DNA-binding CsgD family transcriptional regulator
MKNNRIIYEETAQPESVIRGGDINLTKTEIELIRLLSEGNTSQQIAEKMNISILTVYTHRKNIRNKTHQETNRLISILKDKGILK